MIEQLLVEIENVPVRVALAEDRDEAENVALEFETLAIGVNQALARKFGRGVKRGLDRERVILGRGDDFRLAINAAGGAERRCVLMPLARMASSTLNVAMVFCCKSFEGCSSPKRTSALAAR